MALQTIVLIALAVIFIASLLVFLITVKEARKSEKDLFVFMKSAEDARKAKRKDNLMERLRTASIVLMVISTLGVLCTFIFLR